MQKTCIIIAGPTAVGKTSLAIHAAQHFSSEIISADSRQCYRELNIAVAKPSAEELSLVTHHFINSHSIHDSISAADFEQYALQSISRIFDQNDVAVMVGGTGLYIKSFCDGLDDIPLTDEMIRQGITEQYTLNGVSWLQEELEREDPEYYAQGEIMNPQRMMRALEVKRSTGKSITSFQRKEKKERPFKIIKIGLELPRPILYDRINTRVDDMMQAGLEAEAGSLHPFKNLNALQTVGYREMFSFFNGETSLTRATDLIRQNTRHYAKRQLTWFKKDPEIHWMDAMTSQPLEFILNLVHAK